MITTELFTVAAAAAAAARRSRPSPPKRGRWPPSQFVAESVRDCRPLVNTAVRSRVERTVSDGRSSIRGRKAHEEKSQKGECTPAAYARAVPDSTTYPQKLFFDNGLRAFF